MKQKDIILIIVIVFISGVVSFLVANWTFGSQQNRQQSAEVVDTITAEFRELDKRYFNENSVDPTKIIQIDNNNNQNPFSGTGQ